MTDRFFVVGAQRCGTTYLHSLLDEHPDIVMAKPAIPEPKFFFDDDLFARGLDWYNEHFFPDEGDSRLRGEKSVGYLESDVAAERLAASYPDSRIVVSLRNPIDRAVSNYWFTVDNHLEDLPIEEALMRESAGRVERDGEWFVARGRRIAANPYLYRRRGVYVEDLPRWTRLFGRDRMHIMVFEDTIGSERAITDLYEFLGVDSAVRPETLKTVVHASSGRGSIDEDLRQSLADYFEPHNRRLSEEFSLDLSAWEGTR
jgi:hypothetical protein